MERIVTLQPATRPLKMIRPNGPDNGDYCHEIIQIRLKSGEIYAVDITGAQHGYYESVYPWEQHLQARVRLFGLFGKTLPFGALKAKYCGGHHCAVPGHQGLIRKLQKECAETFDAAIGEWQEKGVTVGEMFRKGSEEGFVRTREELMAHVRGVLQDTVGSLEAKVTGSVQEEKGQIECRSD